MAKKNYGRNEGETMDTNQPVDSTGAEGTTENTSSETGGQPTVADSEKQPTAEVMAAPSDPSKRLRVEIYLKSKGTPQHEMGGKVAYAKQHKMIMATAAQFDELFKNY
jgi:hypothetical protein